MCYNIVNEREQTRTKKGIKIIKNYVKEFAQDIINDSHRLMTEMSKSCPVKRDFYERRFAKQSAKVERIIANYSKGLITYYEAMTCLVNVVL